MTRRSLTCIYKNTVVEECNIDGGNRRRHHEKQQQQRQHKPATPSGEKHRAKAGYQNRKALPLIQKDKFSLMEQAAVYQQPLLFDCPTALLWQSCASSKVDALPFPGLLEYLPSEYSNKTTADQQQQQQQQHKQYQEWIPQSFPFGFIETRRV